MKSVLILIAVFFMVRALKKGLEARSSRARGQADMNGAARPGSVKEPGQGRGEQTVVDPVCGSYVPISSAVVFEIGGIRKHFCSEECRESFISGAKGVDY